MNAKTVSFDFDKGGNLLIKQPSDNDVVWEDKHTITRRGPIAIPAALLPELRGFLNFHTFGETPKCPKP